MSLDITVLRALKRRDRYEKLARSVPRRALDERGIVLLDDMGAFFREFPDVKVLDTDAFATWFRAYRHPAWKDDAVLVYSEIINRMREDASPELEAGIMQRLVAARAAAELTDLLTSYNEGDELDLGIAMRTVVESYEQSIERKVKNPQVLTPIEELLSREENDIGLQWRLPILNAHIKPIRAGDFVVIAARPDKGKTTFIADQLTHMAGQVDKLYPDEGRSIVWLNNEGPGDNIVLRTFQAALGITTEDMVKRSKQPSTDPTRWRTALHQQYAESLGGRSGVLRVFDIHGMNHVEVEDLLLKHKPAAVVYDMIDNIRFEGALANGGQRTDQVLETMYQWARMKAVQLNFSAFATSQISAEGDGMPFPTLPMLKDSKCFAPGTMVRMHDGTERAIEDIKVGEQVMGMDGTPRNVLATGEGYQPMYRVSGKGWYFDCNREHNLVVQNGTSRVTAGVGEGEIRDMRLVDFMETPAYQQRLTAVRCRIPYQQQDLPMDPYLFGLWLGDGAQRECRITTGDPEILAYLESLPSYRSTYKQESNCSDVYFGSRSWLKDMGVWMNKHIPQVYKTASVEQRQRLLAGIMDSDGYIDCGSSCVSMAEARWQLVNDIADVARSLGYRVSQSGKANAVSVCMAVTDALPCLLPRKVYVCASKGDRMTVEPLGNGKFVGITVDGDHRYVLANYVAVRNTGKQGAADVILTIGSSNDPMLEQSRWLGCTKNKRVRTGVSKSPQAEVIFSGDRARYSQPE